MKLLDKVSAARRSEDDGGLQTDRDEDGSEEWNGDGQDEEGRHISCI